LACLNAIHKRALQPYMIDGNEVSATVSIGASAYPDDSTISEELLKRADISMYQAKTNGKSQVVFYSDIAADYEQKTISDSSSQGSYGARPFFEKI